MNYYVPSEGGTLIVQNKKAVRVLVQLRFVSVVWEEWYFQISVFPEYLDFWKLGISRTLEI